MPGRSVSKLVGLVFTAWLAAGLLVTACSSPDYNVAATEDDAGVGATGAKDSGTGAQSSGGGGSSSTGPVVKCTTAENCAGNEQAKLCDTVHKLCVECDPKADKCPTGSYCSDAGDCVVGCANAADCVKGTSCNATTHLCTGCSKDTDCNVGQKCETGTCVSKCQRDADCATGFACCAGACHNLASDEATCGACDSTCQLSHADERCVDGSCELLHCDAGYADCDPKLKGCESLQDDPKNCGRCGKDCAGLACVAGVCKLAACDATHADCDKSPQNGCESNLGTDPANCGGCGQPCSKTNGAASCKDGQCAIVCNSGWGNCDKDASNGCEAGLSTSVDDCGSCGVSCGNANGSTACDASTCKPTCATGFASCDGNARNGCEADTRSALEHCGGCGQLCAPTHATGTCENGACRVLSCAAGFLDCDGDPKNGCEVSSASNVDNCGGCGKACPSTNAAASCAAGLCQFTCKSGYQDCDGKAGNACEADLANSVLTCGACNAVCPSTDGVPNCVSSQCGYSTCTRPRADCDGKAATGCEVNTDTDVNNCGGCGIRCAAENGAAACDRGVCKVQSCDAGYADCDSSYANGCEKSLRTLADCGTCGVPCSVANGVATCGTGSCEIARCTDPYENCDGKATNGCEVNTQSSVVSCGGCGSRCSTTHGAASCTAGSCGIACAANYGDCDGDVTNGCETPTASDALNCGTCGHLCSSNHGVAGCSTGVCQIACSAGYDDCDGAAVNGCETVTSTVGNCGACGVGCSVAQGTPSCVKNVSGVYVCSVAGCNAPSADCNGAYGDGCEINTQTALTACGLCGNKCSYANAGALCSGGACALGTCAAGYGNCDGTAANGCETVLSTTPAHCSKCGQACSLANATAGCSGGACTVASCSANYKNCNGLPADGCEINVSSDANNCSDCGSVCGLPHAVEGCVASKCTVASCDAGYADCDGVATNGCEVNINSDVGHCGNCATVCTAPSGTPVCTAAKCGISACVAPTADCDGLAGNGCEINTSTSVANCGACNAACSPPHATGSCLAGVCKIGACVGLWADCDGNVANGCETDTSSSTSACGGCGTVCGGANGTATCTSGTCGVSCNAGFGNCDGSAANGCETNLKTDATHCGTCATVCSTNHGAASCTAGSCGITCAGGYSDCNASIADGCEASLAATTSCGACGTVCTASNGTPACSFAAGVYSCKVGSCSSGWGDCDGLYGNGCETNTSGSVTNCGSCGFTCNGTNGTPSCATGVCGIACAGGYGNCDGSAANGCETTLASSPSNCGSCGSVCSYAHASALCSASSCQMGTCSPGYGDCTGGAADGCETALTTVTNCGACGVGCSNGHGSTACTSGSCAPSCAAGWANCDGNPNNGCETSLTAATSCGSCGNDCTAIYSHAAGTCAAGACQLGTCNAGYGNCDGSAATGCETDVQTSAANCSSCGNACTNGNGSTACVAGICSPSCTAGYGSCDGNPANGCESSLYAAVVSTTPYSVGNGGTPLTFGHTLKLSVGNNRLVVVLVSSRGNNEPQAEPDTVTFAGATMTKATGYWSGNQAWSGLYYILDAALPAGPGSYSVVITAVGSMGIVASAVEATGMVQTGTVDTVAAAAYLLSCNTGATIEHSVTLTGTRDLVVDVISTWGAGSGVALSGQTELVDAVNVGATGIGGYVLQTSAGAKSIGWTVLGCNNASHSVAAFKSLMTCP